VQNVYAIVDSIPNRVSVRELQHIITKIRIIEVAWCWDRVHVTYYYMTLTNP